MTEAPTTEEAPKPAHRIEPAKSGRSKCKTCRRAIPQGALRFGVLIDGPFGQGYLWHHLRCMAKRGIERVESAYHERAWDDTVEVPDLDELRKLAEEDAQKRKERKLAPHAETAPTGRAACKTCGEKIPEGSFRVVMLRTVELGNQVRHAAVNVHPRCVRDEMDREDSAIRPEDFADAVRANSTGISPENIATVLIEAGY